MPGGAGRGPSTLTLASTGPLYCRRCLHPGTRMIEIDTGVAQRFLVALLIGALVGVEREKNQSASGHRTIAGLRTFILLALLGSVSAWLSLHLASPVLFVVAFAMVALAAITGHVIESRERPEALGLATEFAAITVFLLGGVVMYGYPELAVALGIVTSAVLAFKQPLHGMVARVGDRRHLRGAEAADRELHRAAAAAEPRRRSLGRAESLHAVVAGDPHLGPVAGRLCRGQAARRGARHRAHRLCRRAGVVDRGQPQLRAPEPHRPGTEWPRMRSPPASWPRGR